MIDTLVLVGVTALANIDTGRLEVPHSILLLLPSLLYEAGVGMGWRGFRFSLRPIPSRRWRSPSGCSCRPAC